ncbi:MULTISPECIES: phospholipid carrier-dependent glycosyltransferase [Actinoplanes]|uniref:dolichyl-phosphate-mannose--protein mannosyltransferase n=1 Tax=Actinoplanes TaxID=1865 RepID=UPI0005F2F4FA|nr:MULTISPECIES: phospholipid carrier-dependent glycosyltransferase [Actinoplanes]GLY04407.1 phospholipid carrier-dependent glycosyltransferase [Actinoplanes sp. NBRC 101535]
MTTAPPETTSTSDPSEEVRRAGLRRVPDLVRRRLAILDDWKDPYSWLVTVSITLTAAILRFQGLANPKGYTFDEVYYPTDAWDMLTYGVEWDAEKDIPAYVVHPPLGKWLIALGEYFFGNEEFGWRVSAAVAGTLMVFVLVRLAYRMFRSIVLAGAAGLLMTLDGFQLVLSRTGLLDIFLGLFLLMSFTALVIDRDHYRRRLLAVVEDPFTDHARIVPWWLLTSGVLFGLACGVKWNALFFLPFFGGLVLYWRWQARMSAGLRQTLVRDLGWGLLSVAISAVVYLSTWTGWFVTDYGYFRHYRLDSGLSEPPVLGALLNLAHYHSEAYNFHSGLDSAHPYQSWPWQWLLLGRPVSFDWERPPGCGADPCAAEILLLGTPVLWWSFLPALAALIWLGIARRDWRAWAILTGAGAGLLPWFYFAVADSRTMFSFYALPALPFLILAVVYVLGAVMTPDSGMARGTDRTDRQLIGVVVAGVYVAAVALCFAFFHPVFVGEPIPYEAWLTRMWLGGRWI